MSFFSEQTIIFPSYLVHTKDTRIF